MQKPTAIAVGLANLVEVGRIMHNIEFFRHCWPPINRAGGGAFLRAIAGVKRSRSPPVADERTLKRTPNEQKSSIFRSFGEHLKPSYLKDHMKDHNLTYKKPIMQAYSERTYTASQLAEAYKVSDATIRLRWFQWLCKVAPDSLLRSCDGYTELANTLFAEFSKVDKKERSLWVADAKARYAAEWGSVGVIDCEVMPDNVGSTLALLQTNLAKGNQTLAIELAEVSDFIGQLNTIDQNYSQAELETWAAAGSQRAIAQFRTEEIAHAQTLNTLRQHRMGGEQQ